MKEVTVRIGLIEDDKNVIECQEILINGEEDMEKYEKLKEQIKEFVKEMKYKKIEELGTSNNEVTEDEEMSEFENESSEESNELDEDKDISNSGINPRKRSRDSTEGKLAESSNKRVKINEKRWLKEKERLDEFIEEVKVPNDEKEKEVIIEEADIEVKDIVEQYFKVENIRSEAVRKWYRLGELIEVKVRQNMSRDKRKKNKEKERKNIVKKVTDEIEKEGEMKRKSINDKLEKALKVYELFEKIGMEKMDRIREAKVTTVTNMTKRGFEYVESYFKR
jgi:hypothetical protein